MCAQEARTALGLTRILRGDRPRRAAAAAMAAVITAAIAVPALAGGSAAAATAGFTLTKTASPATVSSPGQVITYTYTVANATGGTLTGLSITDSTSGSGALSAISCPSGDLPNGASMTCAATYMVTNADLALGVISDTATASAIGSGGVTVTSDSATAQVTLAPSSTCTGIYWSGRNSAATAGVFGTVDPATGAYTTIAPLLASSATTALAISTTGLNLGYVTTFGSSGEGYFYAVDLTTGTEFRMNSTALAAAETNRLGAGPDGSLWSWASNNHLYKITLSADGLSVASVTDYGLVTAASGNGTLVQPSTLSSGDIALDGAGNVWLIASNNVNGSGQGPSWLYTVSQSSLTSGASSVPAFQVGQVAGGATSNLNNGLAFAADGQLYTSAQVGNGGESAFYRIDPATGAETLVGTTDTTPYFATDLGSCVLPAPQLTMTKSVSPVGPVRAGSILTYTMNITDTGNATATDVALQDFIPAETTYVPGTTTLNGTPVPDQNGQMPYVTFTNVNSPAALGGNVAAGGTATVTFQVQVDDPLPTSVTHIANQAVATYTGGPPGGIDSSPPGQVAGQPPSDTTTEVDNPQLTIAKSATSRGLPVTGTLFPGQPIDYSFVVTNTGNVPLSAVTVDETQFTGSGGPPAVSCPTATLAPGNQETCTATYAITQADVNAGHISNTATATGTPPSGPTVTAPASSAVVPEPAAPDLSIRKTVTPTVVTAAGDRVTYSFAVTNTGNVTLTDVHVDETAFSGTGPRPTVSCPSEAASLDAGATVRCTAAYPVTQADMDAGQVSNTATASGTPPSGPAVTSSPSSAVVNTRQSPVITLHKTSSPRSVRAAGDRVRYTFTVGNAGDVTLHDVTVTDTGFTGTGSRPTVTCPAAPLTLTPRQTATCTATYRVTQADMNQTRFSDTARAAGTAPDGRVVHAVASAVVQAPPRPALALKKTVAPATAAVGDKLTYTFAITNTGNETLYNVTVVEEKFTGSGHLSAVDCPTGTAVLAPGATVSCTASYTVTAVDATAGKIANTAIARGRTSHGRVLIIPPVVTAPPRAADVTVVPSGVSAGFPGKPTQANALLLSAGGGLILGGLLLGSLLLARRRLTSLPLASRSGDQRDAQNRTLVPLETQTPKTQNFRECDRSPGIARSLVLPLPCLAVLAWNTRRNSPRREEGCPR